MELICDLLTVFQINKMSTFFFDNIQIKKICIFYKILNSIVFI